MDHEEANDFEMTEDEFNLARLLHLLINNGEIRMAKSFLAIASPETRHRIARPNKDPPLHPALFLAIERGNLEFVKLLVDECGANFNENISVGGQSINEHEKWMTPLEIAISIRNYNIVEYLMSLGVDIDRLAKDANTLLEACKSRALKTIQILLNHGADVNASDEEGNTCLMLSVRDLGMCRFLIDNGADVNKVNNRGNTALHLAAAENCHLTTQLLIESGSDVYRKNENGLDALQEACCCCSVATVNVLTKTFFTDANRRIEAHKLLGTSFFLKDRELDAFSEWTRAIEMSFEFGIVTPAATLSIPFGVVVEAITVSDINDLRQDHDQACMQCILLIHKSFGPTSAQFFYTIVNIISKYFQRRLYARWLIHLIYCFEMTQNLNLNLQALLRVIERISVHVNICLNALMNMDRTPSLHFDLVYKFMRRIVEKATACTHSEESEWLMKLMLNGALMLTLVYCASFQKMDFHKLIRSAIQTLPGRRLLVHALDTSAYQIFDADSPHQEVIAMLLECGADVNERDRDGNNVLHMLMASRMDPIGSIRPIDQVKKLARTFIEKGVHLDARNHAGLEATSFLKELGIDVVPPINLMCSAARAIRRFKIHVEGILPKFLVDFVEMH